MKKIFRTFISAAAVFIAAAAFVGPDCAYAQKGLIIKTPKKTESQQKIEDTLKAHVSFLTSDLLNGRGAGSDGELKTAEYLYNYLSGNGVLMLSPKEGDDFKIAGENGDTLSSRNIIGIIPGYDSKLNGEYVVIGAHMDGFGCNILNVNGSEKKIIFRSADCNASGTAVLMQVAKMISQNKFMFRRSVIIAAFGAGEYNMAGSWYFINRSFGEKDKITAMIDLDCVGRSGDENKLSVFTGVQNTDINHIIEEIASRPFSSTPQIIEKEPFPSDYRNFYEKNIPAVLFTTGTNAQRHTAKDTPELLDYFQMNGIAEFVYSFALVAATREQRLGLGLTAEEASVNGEKEKVYTQQDVNPRAKFLRGDERKFLQEWVYQYIKYPDSAVSQGIEGTEDVEFVIDRNGNLRDVKIMHSLSEDIDHEVYKVLRASPKWSPAKISGRNVSVKISLPIKFILTKENKKFGIKK